MAGIEDLTNMMMTGTRTDVPPVQGPPVAAGGPPPMSGPPVGGPPPMSGPRMDASDPRMDPMEGGMSIEGDATALAQAVVSRTGGDIASARAVLAQADMLLSQADDREPRMAADGGELKAVPEDNPGLSKLPEKVRNRMGYMNMGGPVYAASGKKISNEGRDMSDKDADMLRQIIMDNIKAPEGGKRFESGRLMSDKDKEAFTQSGRRMSNNDLDTLGLSADAYYEQYFK